MAAISRKGRPIPKQPYKRMPARGGIGYTKMTLRKKKGRTGAKRRAVGGTMQKHAAPVAMGTSMAHGRRGPGGVGYSMTQVSDTCTRITGRAYVGEITTAGKVVTNGSGLGLIFDVNPALLNDRVAVIASTFEKYVYHGMKFTYVPQCPTATSGSVGLCFDRDPLQYTANTQGTQFLSEVMSYEHAVLTPAYVEASTAFGRDPKELKTWFLSSTDATLTTRETSQGNLVVYFSNCPATTGLGYIVMDYVLDLVAPNLLPSKQGVTNIYSGPSQWRDLSGSKTGALANTTFTALNAVQLPLGAGATTGTPIFSPTAGWYSVVDAGVSGGVMRPGVVGEIQFGGCVGNDTSLAVARFVTADSTAVTVKAGQKLYFAQHVYNDAVGGDYKVVTFHLTLGSARAASAVNFANQAGLTASVFGDYLFADAAAPNPSISGWLRLITDGCGVVDSA